MHSSVCGYCMNHKCSCGGNNFYSAALATDERVTVPLSLAQLNKKTDVKSYGVWGKITRISITFDPSARKANRGT